MMEAPAGDEYGYFTTVKAEDVNENQIPQPKAVDMGLAPKCPFRLVVTGASGQGKTTVANHLLSKVYKGYFDERVMFSPTAEWDPSWKSANFTKKEIKEDLDPDFLHEVYEKAEQECKTNGAAKAKQRLFIFDDCIADQKFMHSPEMLKMFVQGRHCNISIMMLTQSYMKVDRSCRLQASDILFFPSNLSEVERLVKEHCPPNCSNKEFRKLVLHATKKKYNFLSICKRMEPHEMFRRNFDTILNIGEMGNDDVQVDDDDVEDDAGEEADGEEEEEEEEAQPPPPNRRAPHHISFFPSCH